MPLNNQYLLKIRSVLPLFTLLAWGTVIVLGLFRWIFFLSKYPVLEVNEEMWEIYIPAFVAIIPIWFGMKFRRLTFRKKPAGWLEQFRLIGYFTLFGMLAVSQAYLSTFDSHLVRVNDVKQIGKTEEGRYYKIDTFAVHIPMGGAYYTSRVDGRFQSNLKFEIYFVNPILTHKKQILTMTPMYWYGVKFEKKVSNWLSKEEKQQRFSAFYQDCVAKMLKYNFYKLDHFERKPASHDRESFLVAVSNALQKPVNKDFVVLEPRLKSFENKNQRKIVWTFAVYFIGCGIYMLALIKPGYRSEFADEAAEPIEN